MEELEIILEQEIDNEVDLEILEEEIQKVYPELEDLEVTPKLEEQKFKSSKYGYNQVIVKGTEGIIEDLSVELTEQDNLLTTQAIIIQQIIEALKNKSGDNDDFTVLELEKIIVSNLENKIVEEVEA